MEVSLTQVMSKSRKKKKIEAQHASHMRDAW